MSVFTVNTISGDYAVATVCGIPFNFDDRTGSKSVWNISLFIDGIDETLQSHGFMDFQKLKSENQSFVQIKQVINIDEDAYRMNFLADSTVQLSKQLLLPGRTSLSTITKLVDLKSGKRLVERLIKFVSIDNKTRSPLRNPDWFLEQFSYLRVKGVPNELSRQEIPKPPKSCFEYRTTIRYSDLDANFHTNHTVYIKLCLDCATLASFRGKLVHFSEDICSYPVHQISTDYLGECFAGDVIEILLWQDDKDISELKFAIYQVKDHKQLTFVVCRFGLNKIKKYAASSKL